MACNDCPELNPNPNEGCLQPINSSCVTYDGNDVDCADIASGQTISQVIETLANNDCELQEQIDDIKGDLQELSGVVLTIEDKIQELSGNQYEFSCEQLSECELNSLGNVDTNPVSGDSIIFNGEKWISYTPEQLEPYQFTCQELSGCSLDSLGNVIESSPLSGEVLIFNGTNWVNSSIPVVKNYSVQNGLNESPSETFKLGGSLLENTSFDGNYDFYFGNKNYIFGDDNSLIGSTGFKFVHKLTKSLNSLPQGFSTNFKNSIFTIDTGFSLSAGQGLFNDNNLTRLYVNNSKSIPFSSKMANQTSYLQFRGTGTPTLTMDGFNGNIGVLANHMSYLMLDNDTNNAANKAKVTHLANYYSLITAQNVNHNEITNFYHCFLADATNNLATPSYIANSYGVYQEGQTEKNYFAGEIFMLPNLPVYADNAAATSGGLPTGALYRTSTGDLKVRY